MVRILRKLVETLRDAVDNKSPRDDGHSLSIMIHWTEQCWRLGRLGRYSGSSIRGSKGPAVCLSATGVACLVESFGIPHKLISPTRGGRAGWKILLHSVARDPCGRLCCLASERSQEDALGNRFPFKGSFGTDMQAHPWQLLRLLHDGEAHVAHGLSFERVARLGWVKIFHPSVTANMMEPQLHRDVALDMDVYGMQGTGEHTRSMEEIRQRGFIRRDSLEGIH